MAPTDWDVDAAIARCPVAAWQGSAWRIHRQRYAADDPGGSLKVSGRYHRGSDRFPAEASWPSLYLALSPETCLGELIRHVTPELLPHLNGYRISELTVSLAVVVDCRDTSILNVAREALIDDRDYSITQQLGAAAHSAGVEGLLVPSATALGDNLIVLPTNLRPASRIALVSSRDPRLFVSE